MRHTLWYNILRSLPNDHVKFSNRRFWRLGEPIAENHSFSAFIRKSFVPINWTNASRSTWNNSKRLNLKPSYILKWNFRCSNSLKLRVTKSTKSSVKQRERWNWTMPIPPDPLSANGDCFSLVSTNFSNFRYLCGGCLIPSMAKIRHKKAQLFNSGCNRARHLKLRARLALSCTKRRPITN